MVVGAELGGVAAAANSPVGAMRWSRSRSSLRPVAPMVVGDDHGSHLDAEPAVLTSPGILDSPRERPAIRCRLVACVGELCSPIDDVVVERNLDPPAWADRGQRGTPFSLGRRFFPSGPFRARNVDRRVPGRFLVGMGTVPGVGTLMVLLSGRLAADRVDAWGPR